MMKRNEIIAITLIVLSTIGTVIGVFAVEKFRRGKVYTVQLIARQPKYGNWYPRKVNVP